MVVGRGAYARQHRAEAGSFRAAIFAVADVEIVNDLPDGDEADVIRQLCADEQRLEAAPVAFMGELGIGHIEPQFACLWLMAAGIDEPDRSEEHTSELQSLMRISSA